MLNREIHSMEQLHHPNIVRLFEVIETYSKIFLVMELASGGELYQRIQEHGSLEEREAAQLFAQIISAVDHLVSDSNQTSFVTFLCLITLLNLSRFRYFGTAFV